MAPTRTRSAAPIWFFNIEEPGYNMPFGFGAGKVIEPQFAMAVRGVGQPVVQIFGGINMQFKVDRKKPKKRSDDARYLVGQLASEQGLRAQMQ